MACCRYWPSESKKCSRCRREPGPQSGGSAIWALVGPTGVGKTTTVAKLAANYGLKLGLKVGLITLDTFRIAAAEQLKVYGQIMQLPIIVAGNSREYQRALDELSGCDLVMVDTVGRAPGDEGNLLELRSILAARSPNPKPPGLGLPHQGRGPGQGGPRPLASSTPRA